MGKSGRPRIEEGECAGAVVSRCVEDKPTQEVGGAEHKIFLPRLAGELKTESSNG